MYDINKMQSDQGNTLLIKKYAKKSQNVELNSWIKFMNNPKEMENMENSNKQIEKAKEVLKEISGKTKEEIEKIN